MQRIANPWTSVRFREAPPFSFREIATLAQLVERNLAKVEVTSSNLVCRSKFTTSYQHQLVERNLAKVEVTLMFKGKRTSCVAPNLQHHINIS